MGARADKYRARQGLVLTIATFRVWRTRERGQLMEQVRASRLLKTHLERWKTAKKQNDQRLCEQSKIMFLIQA
jgi:hypothetical protein